MLKKGTTSLAQRARAASRILEAQVGTNPRIRVQRDDAFVPWDKISFKDMPPSAESDKAKVRPPSSQSPGSSPEWVRRTICCAQWEIDNATPKADTNPSGIASEPVKPKPKVILAVLASLPHLSPPTRPGRLSPTGGNLDPPTPLTPVPLPAPSLPHGNKHEPRSTGTLIA